MPGDDETPPNKTTGEGCAGTRPSPKELIRMALCLLLQRLYPKRDDAAYVKTNLDRVTNGMTRIIEIWTLHETIRRYLLLSIHAATRTKMSSKSTPFFEACTTTLHEATKDDELAKNLLRVRIRTVSADVIARIVKAEGKSDEILIPNLTRHCDDIIKNIETYGEMIAKENTVEILQKLAVDPLPSQITSPLASVIELTLKSAKLV